MKTEIYVDGISIDLIEDFPISLNYSIADIRQPENRQTNYSKTITLPGSKTNKTLFASLFEVNVDVYSTGTTNFSPTFNPNLKANIIVLSDRIEVFKGIMQLTKINVLDDYSITFDVVLFGNLANIFQTIGDGKLTDLTFDGLNHTLNKTNIEASWVSPYGYGYVYPMIDYGRNNLVNWKVTDFFPAIYLKEYIDKIFAYSGFSYSSTFFYSDFFRKLIIPYNGDTLKLTDAQIRQRMFKAYNSSTTDVNANVVQWTGEFNAETFDYGSNYNNSTYKFTAPQNGTYIFYCDLSMAFRYQPSTAAFVHPIQVFIRFVKNSTTVFSQQLTSGNLGGVMLNYANPGDVSSTATETVASQVYLNSGDTLNVVFDFVSYTTPTYYHNGAGSGVSGDIYFRLNSNSFFYNSVVNSGIQEGENIDMNGAIPKDIKMKDLLVSVIRAFNLYIEEDKSQSNRLVIETRNDYYTSGTTVDWTNKLDVSQTIEIIPMGALDARRYSYSYVEDSDYYNKLYKDTYNKTYGNRYVDITNDFLKNENETKIIFAPTPTACDSWTNRAIPSIFQVDGSGNKQMKTSKIRLLYWGGLKSCFPNWNLIHAGGTTVKTSYPYSGHLDDAFSSTIDLNFGISENIYWVGNTINYTNNNLYNKYYKKFLAEITDKDSKIVIAYMRLTVKDILTLDFRNQFLVDNTYYRINKIIDFNPTIDGLTKVELLKIKYAIPFVESSATLLGGAQGDVIGIGNGRGSGNNTPLIRSNKQRGGNTLDENTNYNIIVGLDNYVHATSRNVIVSGDYNVVGAFCQNVSLINSSGCVVYGGMTNVTLINSSGVTVSDSAKIYVNNKNVSKAQGYNVLYSRTSSVSSAASASLQTLDTYVLQANTLDNDGDYLIIEVDFTCASNTNSKNVRITTPNVSTTSYTTTTSGDSIKYFVKVLRESSSAYRSWHWVIANSSTVPIGNNSGMATNFTSTFQIDVKCTPTVAASGEVVLTGFNLVIFKEQ